MAPRGNLDFISDESKAFARWAAGVIVGELLVRILNPWLDAAADFIRHLLCM